MSTTIDLPDNLYEKAEEKRKREGFTSVSEVIRHLLRNWLNE